ncbi:MAG TPA: hypothetical protein VJ993_08790, partial [Woeseiaceae bacterium]|nr:hypothetical protein [Woeseiaceae bacterium]
MGRRLATQQSLQNPLPELRAWRSVPCRAASSPVAAGARSPRAATLKTTRNDPDVAVVAGAGLL